MDRTPLGYTTGGILAPFATGDVAVDLGGAPAMSVPGPTGPTGQGAPGQTGPLAIPEITGPAGPTGVSGFATGTTGVEGRKKATVLSQQKSAVATGLSYSVPAGTMSQDADAMRVTSFGRNTGATALVGFSFSGLGQVGAVSVPPGGNFRFQVILMRSGGGDVKIIMDRGSAGGVNFVYAVGFIGGWLSFSHNMQVAWTTGSSVVSYMLVEKLSRIGAP